MKTVCLILKAPREGTVKTRLARDIGPQKATAIYRALVEHQAQAIPQEWDVAVHFSPPDAGIEMESWLKPHLPSCVRFVPQCKGHLGMRLAHVVRTELSRGAERVFLVGGDCPGMTRSYLVSADGNLDEADLVMGPATDGGYVLMAIKAFHAGLFENIDWSTSAVLAQTLAAAHRWSITFKLLPPLEDIDDLNSYRRQFDIVKENALRMRGG
jgi:rSAM/selenodomain-associated transferase 1